MKYLNIIRRETKVMIIVVIMLLVVVLGVSYALFMQVTDNTNNQVVTTGTLQIEYASSNGYISEETYSELLPMSNDKGLEQTGYEFSVKNTGTLPVTYQVFIYINYTGFNEDKEAGLVDGEIFEELNLIKYNLQTNDDGNKNINKLSEEKIYKENDILKYVLAEEKVEGANDINNHKLKIWLDEDTDIENIGKYIYLKLEVTSYITGQEQVIGCEITKDEDSDGIADIGDMVTCGETESFYVYSNDGETIKMLAQYNLYVGGEFDTTTTTYNLYGEEATGLQNSLMLGYTNDNALRKGTTAFSDDTIKGISYSDYEGSIVEKYVNNYALKLKEMGVNASDVTLISKEELEKMSGTTLLEDSIITWAPEWLYQTTYWTTTKYDDTDIWSVVNNGNFDNYGATAKYICGVRPVVHISVDEI